MEAPFDAVVEVGLEELFYTPCDLRQRHLQMLLSGKLAQETMSLDRVQVVLDKLSDNTELHALITFLFHRFRLLYFVVGAPVCIFSSHHLVYPTLHFEVMVQVVDSFKLGLIDGNFLMDDLGEDVGDAELVTIHVFVGVHGVLEVVLVEQVFLVHRHERVIHELAKVGTLWHLHNETLLYEVHRFIREVLPDTLTVGEHFLRIVDVTGNEQIQNHSDTPKVGLGSRSCILFAANLRGDENLVDIAPVRPLFFLDQIEEENCADIGDSQLDAIQG